MKETPFCFRKLFRVNLLLKKWKNTVLTQKILKSIYLSLSSPRTNFLAKILISIFLHDVFGSFIRTSVFQMSQQFSEKHSEFIFIKINSNERKN